MKVNIILLCLYVLTFVSISQGLLNPNDYKTTIEEVISKENEKPNAGEDADRSSGDVIVIPEEAPPLNILRDITRPKREGDFFKDELIEILIKITTQKKGGLKQIEFWEIPGDDLYIMDCSYQLRTSNIQEMLDYEEHDKSLLKEKDIIDVRSIISSLKNSTDFVNSSNKSAMYELDNYIYKKLSNNTTKLLSEYDLNSPNEHIKKMFLQNLTKDFNKIIENNSIDSINRTILNKYNIKIDRKRVSSLNPNSKAYHNFQDYNLQNRLILEHKYPGMLRNLSFSKEHERQNLAENDNAIKIIEKNLRQGETIIFKYYLNPINSGKKEIRYIVRADDYFLEGIEIIKVSERGEKFSIDYQCDSKDIIWNKEKKFTYYIEYLGGNKENTEFFVNITPPDGCRLIEGSWKDGNKSKLSLKDGHLQSESNILFSKGKIEELSLVATYTKMGLRVAPPTISIGNFTEKFETDLSVYADYDNPFRVHFEFYSIFLTFAAIIISLIVAIFSSIEIYLTHSEIKLTREKIEQEAKSRRKQRL